MIYITEATCCRCGQPVRISAIFQVPDQGTADLYLKVGPGGITEAQAICKNAQICDGRQTVERTVPR